jgi:hypothetical protein
MKLIKLESEKDYLKINHLPFNRKFGVRQDLIESMNEFGFTVPILILKTDIMDGKPNYWFVDGQHRMITAQFLQIPSFAIVIESEKIKTKDDIVLFVASLNSRTKKWTMLNYVEAYNYLNYKEYEILIKTHNNYPYSINTIASLLAGKPGRGGVAKEVHEGKFIVTDLEGTKDCLNFAANLSKYQRMTSRMLLSLRIVMNNSKFNKKSFMNSYKDNAKNIKDLDLNDYSNIFLSWLK